MPANGKCDLIQRLKVNKKPMLNGKIKHSYECQKVTLYGTANMTG